MAQPILTIGDVEPERPTVAIHRNAPDGPWQAFKHRHFDVLLRWLPVRYTRRRDLYAMRMPTEFGIRDLQRIAAAQREVGELQERDYDEAAMRRVEFRLREISEIILDAPRSVIEGLSPSQHIQLLLSFGVAATGAKPTPPAAESPATSADSSPASTASTAPGTG